MLPLSCSTRYSDILHIFRAIDLTSESIARTERSGSTRLPCACDFLQSLSLDMQLVYSWLSAVCVILLSCAEGGEQYLAASIIAKINYSALFPTYYHILSSRPRHQISPGEEITISSVNLNPKRRLAILLGCSISP